VKRGEMRSRLRRGIYVVPTSLTVLNLFFGFRSIVNSTRGIEATVQGQPFTAAHFFQVACVSLFIAALFDTFDGLVARLMHATSEFGKEYDSLADVVTFGAAPGILIYAWGLHVLGTLGGAIAFLFLVAGSLRLARFNIMTAKADHRYFVGLPIPAGALTLAAIINYAPTPVTDTRFAWVMLFVTAGLAFAMVSTIRYRSQKYANLQRERSLMYFVVLALIVGLFSKWPREFCFIAAVCYASSGPLIRLWSIAFPGRNRPLPPPRQLGEEDDEEQAQPHLMVTPEA
jgi:CDP-diacylglycerol---serine O-phosphatidyltransferase